jgi:hypothetical protein
VTVELEKKHDGASVLRCVRGDGSATYQRHEGRQAAFFPAHDLTHFAVESELSRSVGFFGLVASGWDIEDTTGKGTRGPLPQGAIEVERIVGLIDLERAGVACFTSAELGLSAEEAESVRGRLADLLSRWEAVPRGGTLELTFDR